MTARRILSARVVAASAIVGGLMFALPAAAQMDQQNLVNAAKGTIAAFKSDSKYAGFVPALERAKAVLVVPSLFKAAVGIGGEGGSGILMARDPMTGSWSYPAFYRLTGGSLGPQLGAEESETVFLIMTDKGLNRLMANELKLGADASVAIPQSGTGVKGTTTTNFDADIIAYTHSSGLYVGASLDGTVVSPNDAANRAYYGAAASSADIVLNSKVRNEAADPLRAALKGG